MHKLVVALLVVSIIISPGITGTAGSALIKLRSNGTFSMEMRVVEKLDLHSGFELKGLFIYGELISINVSQTIEKNEYINVYFDLVKKNSIYYGNVSESYKDNSNDFYLRKTMYSMKIIDNNTLNISYLNINVTTNNKKIILYWNITLLSLALLCRNEEIRTRYTSSNNLFQLSIIVKNAVIDLNLKAKKLFSDILFTRYNYTIIWDILQRIKRISTVIRSVNDKMNIHLYYSIDGLNLAVDKSKYILPLMISIGNNTFDLVTIPIGLADYVLFTRISWNSTCTNGSINSFISAKGIGLGGGNIDKIHSIMFSARSTIGYYSKIKVVGIDLYFDIDGNKTNSFILNPNMNTSKIKIIYKENNRETASNIGTNPILYLVFIVLAVTFFILLYILRRHHVFSR